MPTVRQSLNRRDKAISDLQYLYSRAESFGFTSQKINEEYSKIIPQAPAWVRAYVDGYRRALDDALYRDKLEFCYIHEGIRYSVRDGAEHGTDQLYAMIEPSTIPKLVHGHFWIKTGKPFFIGD